MIAECPCETCVYAADPVDGEAATCKAFPTGIPEMILRGENDHTQPIPGDHGILYRARGSIQRNGAAVSSAGS